MLQQTDALPHAKWQARGACREAQVRLLDERERRGSAVEGADGHAAHLVTHLPRAHAPMEADRRFEEAFRRLTHRVGVSERDGRGLALRCLIAQGLGDDPGEDGGEHPDRGGGGGGEQRLVGAEVRHRGVEDGAADEGGRGADQRPCKRPGDDRGKDHEGDPDGDGSILAVHVPRAPRTANSTRTARTRTTQR